MSYTAIQGTPIFVNLLLAAKDTGWTFSGSTAHHETCNQGNLRLSGYSVIIGRQYTVTYQITNISSGGLQLFLGGTAGTIHTTPGFYTETLTATTTDSFFYSDANCDVELFNIEIVAGPVSMSQQNTLAYSERTNKWGAWYTFFPDVGTSLFVNTFTYYQGNLYLHEHNSPSRCEFYGIQFPAQIKFSTNEQPTISKTFSSITYQGNELLITSPSGINTANGQVSELISDDFLQYQLNDGVITVDVYDVEGMYDANFLRDIPSGINNGNILQGNWMTINLITNSPSSVLQLFSTEIIYTHSYANTR